MELSCFGEWAAKLCKSPDVQMYCEKLLISKITEAYFDTENIARILGFMFLFCYWVIEYV